MRVLLVKTSSLGDVIHTLPALTDAARAIPGIQFDWVVEEGFAEIPAWHPAVARVIPVAIRRWRKNLWQTLRNGEWRRFKQRLKEVDYDLVIDAQGLLKSAWLTRYVGKTPVAGLDGDSAREPLASRFYRRAYPVAWGQHAVERTRQLFAQALDYPLPESVGDYGLDREQLADADPGAPYLVFLHGTTWVTKHWPEAYWRELAERMCERGWSVRLPWGSAAERERAGRLAAGLENAAVLPRLSLAGMAKVLAGARACVAERDFMRIALECQRRGHDIRVYTLIWEGDVPDGFEVLVAPVRSIFNHRRNEKFTAWVRADLDRRPVQRVIGFNKMPGLDVYYAADACFEEKAQTLRNPLYRQWGRYRHFAGYERAVFDPASKTEILMISEVQQPLFVKHYGTQAERFHLLPPGISQDRRAPANAADVRAEFRREFGLEEDDLLLVQIGSGFKTKGLDRSLKALAALPKALRRRTRLIAIGQDDPKPFLLQIAALGLNDQVQILKGRSDIPRFLLGADLLIHPAYNENTGTVLLEALVSGLPVLVTDVCGYAHYIAEADAGRVLPSPFEQDSLNRLLAEMLEDAPARAAWSRNGLAYADHADLYSMPQRAADLILGEAS